jgi:hypothetical protein
MEPSWTVKRTQKVSVGFFKMQWFDARPDLGGGFHVSGIPTAINS